MWRRLGTDALLQALNDIGLSRLGELLTREEERAEIRRADGGRSLLFARTVSPFDQDSITAMAVRPIGNENQFAVTLPDRVLIFGFDPPRNWAWLVGWGLGPIVVLETIRRWRAGREHQRRSSTMGMSAPTVEPV